MHNTTVRDIFGSGRLGLQPDSGEVGLEIEVEGQLLPTHFMNYWIAHSDNSLHIPEIPSGAALEYVLRVPVQRSDVVKVLSYLTRKIEESNGRVRESTRTSVHVHLNMLDFTMKQVYNVICAYIIMEDLLTLYCGPDREGNLFCLRAADAEFIVNLLKNAVKNEQYNNLTKEEFRYAGLNPISISKFGSLEFRTMRGCVDKGNIDIPTIVTWVKILTSLKDCAVEFNSPIEIVESLSLLGAQGFLEKFFSDDIIQILTRPMRSDFDLSNRLYCGVRLAQDIAYASEWEKEKPKTKKNESSEHINTFNSTVQEYTTPSPDFSVQELGTIGGTISVARSRIPPSIKQSLLQVHGNIFRWGPNGIVVYDSSSPPPIPPANFYWLPVSETHGVTVWQLFSGSDIQTGQ